MKTSYKASPILPFRLHDISDFVIDKHPVLHPFIKHLEYRTYWKEQVTNCIIGKWGYDYNKKTNSGGYRFMPGNLYFYINMTQIKIEGDEGSEEFSRPYLRDIEWLMYYAFTEADGFAGFEEDENYTAYKPIGKLQGKIKDSEGKPITHLMNYEHKRIKKYERYLLKPNGEYKEYVEPRELLYRTYNRPIGRALYLNEAQNIILLSSRGVGKSYGVSGGVVQYDFTFGSARTYKDYVKRMKPSVTVVGSSDSKKSMSLLSKFEDSYEYTRANVGAFNLNGIEISSPFYQPFRGSIKSGNMLTNRVKTEGSGGLIGTGNQLWHVSYKDNASAGVGERARRMVVEEAGLASNFADIHSENTGSQKRETKTGYTIYIGTGGNVEKIKGIREAFYDPFSYDALSFTDNFSNKPGSIGLFIPAYYRSMDYKDEKGNTDYIAAFEDEMEVRALKMKTGSKSYEGWIISYPIIPSEMFLQSSGNIFPTKLLEQRLTDLETGEWKKIAKPGTLEYVNKEKTKVIWIPKSLAESSIVKRYGDEKKMSDEEVAGTIVIYEPPVPVKPELAHYDYLYAVVYDPIRDEDGGTSLACVQVWKFWDFNNPEYPVKFNMVAEWLGRHIGTDGLRKDHDIAFKLASYYEAPILPEINLKDILSFGRLTRRYYYFLPKPELAVSGMQIKQKKDYPVGLYISPQMKPDLEKYLNETLHTIIEVEHTIEGSEERRDVLKMVSAIPSMRLVEELLYYNRDDNFDSVSAAMLFGTIKRQREEEVDKRVSEEIEVEDDSTYLEFFNPANSNNNNIQYRDNIGFNY